MPTINQLSAVDSVAAADAFPIYSSANGDTRKASATAVAAFLQSQITAIDDRVTQFSAPSATGFTVAILDGPQSVWLVLTPVAGYAAGTVALPALADCVDKQEILCNCTQAVTTFTVAGNGATVTGAPSTLAANGYFRLRFEGVTKTWYRV